MIRIAACRGEIPRILRGREDAHEEAYLTDAFGREAVSFIDRHRDGPFFLYLAFNAPHGPLQATEKYLKRFGSIADETRRTYDAMVSALDDVVGAVLAGLHAAGLDERTLVVFLSDNGGPTDVNGSSNSPLRGVKGETCEGGIRVPFLLRWPSLLPAGATYDRTVIQLDLHPTALAASGVPASADARLDGGDLLPYLEGLKAGDPHEVLYWRFNFPPRQPARYKWAIRRGDRKLFTDVDANRKNKARAADAGRRMLVDLADDIGEGTDLSGRHPEEVKSLEADWRRWDAEMAAPGATPERHEEGRGGDR